MPRLRKEGFEVVFFWDNPNIYPEEEMQKRLDEVRRWAQKNKIELVEREWGHEEWLGRVKGKEQEQEGGERCVECYRVRLEKTAEEAKKRGIPYFGSTLTNSRHKRADKVNPVGVEVGERVGVIFWEGDWKKGGGELRSVEISREEGFYRQGYCGCEWSLAKSKMSKHE